ncbi:radical SAM protein [Eubacteriaceae bacterium ES2]|nr:radical SAM protein [Eubacteriaceae bacterium ES2]
MNTIPAKSILLKNKNSAWFGTDYTMNLYRGCPHGCIYCDSRSECYGITNFATVCGKENAIALLEDTLKRKRQSGVIGLGSMSDPYNPQEKKYQLTRQALDLINRYQFGLALATKSPLITRDFDLFAAISQHSPLLVKITITAADDDLSKKIEPGVAPSSQRFKAIKTLSDSGIFCGILLMPVLPFITDSPANIKAIVRMAKESGAAFVYPSFGVTLRDRQRLYYFDQLDQLFPGLKKKYLTHFGNQYSCGSLDAKTLKNLFDQECQRHDLLCSMPAIIEAYQKKKRPQQISFFDSPKK